MHLRTLSILIAAASFLPITSHAQELVYQPNNPSFGGNPFNSSHLLGIANAQNGYEAPRDEEAQETQAELFLRQLQTRLLSGLATEVTNAIFGDDPQENGRVVFGDQVIEFTRGLDSVTIVVTDGALGTTTEIILPLFSAG